MDKCNRKTLMFAPTVVTGVKPGDALLAEEIFGKHFATRRVCALASHVTFYSMFHAIIVTT